MAGTYVDTGGDDIGPSPFDMLFGSLGACTVVMLTQYASKAKIPVTGIWIDVSGKWLGKPYHVADGYELERHIKVRGDLSEKDLQRLEKAADRCPVHQLLDKGATIKTTIEKV